VVIGAVAGAVAVVLGAGFVGCGRPPQMGADEEAFKAVDALFTAVTARDEKLLEKCERRLEACREARKIPAGASAYLGGVVRTARAGGWESAARRLYEFMTAQRREGAREHAPKKGPRRAGSVSDRRAPAHSGR
jgi:hypothetical protein